MTRNEQILSEVQKHFINDTTHIASKINAFVDGVKWADEHPKPGTVNKQEFIEKVVKYLEANFPDIENVGGWYKESFINNFLKVMEE